MKHKKKLLDKTAMHELTVMYTRPLFNDMPIVNNSDDAINIIRKMVLGISLDYQEYVWCMYLNNANKVLGYCEIGKGDATGAIVNVPQIFAIALKVSAKALILVHNHPSGKLKASMADKKIVERIQMIGSLFSISLLDSVIVTSESFYSFADEGLILIPDNIIPF